MGQRIMVVSPNCVETNNTLAQTSAKELCHRDFC